MIYSDSIAIKTMYNNELWQVCWDSYLCRENVVLLGKFRAVRSCKISVFCVHFQQVHILYFKIHVTVGKNSWRNSREDSFL